MLIPGRRPRHPARPATPDSGGGQPSRSPNEALLREWPRLKEWLEGDVEGDGSITPPRSASDRVGRGRPPPLGAFPRPPFLPPPSSGQAAHTDDLTAREAQFLERGRAQVDTETAEAHRRADEQVRVNRRLRRRLAFVAVALAAALVAGAVALDQRGSARQQHGPPRPPGWRQRPGHVRPEQADLALLLGCGRQEDPTGARP